MHSWWDLEGDSVITCSESVIASRVSSVRIAGISCLPTTPSEDTDQNRCRAGQGSLARAPNHGLLSSAARADEVIHPLAASSSLMLSQEGMVDRSNDLVPVAETIPLARVWLPSSLKSIFHLLNRLHECLDVGFQPLENEGGHLHPERAELVRFCRRRPARTSIADPIPLEGRQRPKYVRHVDAGRCRRRLVRETVCSADASDTCEHFAAPLCNGGHDNVEVFGIRLRQRLPRIKNRRADGAGDLPRLLVVALHPKPFFKHIQRPRRGVLHVHVSAPLHETLNIRLEHHGLLRTPKRGFRGPLLPVVVVKDFERLSDPLSKAAD
eukprot:scaffold1954_cov268-Pinguiococcus_pyrenoidosus.AAC.128